MSFGACIFRLSAINCQCSLMVGCFWGFLVNNTGGLSIEF